MDRSRLQRRGGGLAISEPIMKTAALLLRGFICDEIGSKAESVAELAREQVSQDPHIQLLVVVLRLIAQKMGKDEELQRSVTALDGVHTAANFFQVAGQIFSNGIAWGLVAVLFRLASKLVLQALNDDKPEQIELIMDWTLHFIQVRLLAWIQAQGGWDDIL
ncbi:apoptosis regulator BAX-like isoform X2 [Talpa occidentalis]|uniref:apoptosis regulator BAX-like isoform X2 n=1 Tax=Talpa occidentalis TaxID=50954 RepID=UPI00188FECD4|nr:apoptosis regulator BAX-like isoform X2 [Talpa occidentalis]